MSLQYTRSMESLSNARAMLESALIHYKDMWLALLNCSRPGATFNDIRNRSDIIINEVKLYAAFETEATRVKRLLNKARNSLFSFVPINALPDEILLRLFRIVVHKNYYEFIGLVDHDSLPVHSLAFSQVCTRWRQVALSSGDLWSSIDISLCNKSISLGTLFADRSGDLPSKIRVIEPLKQWDPRDRYSTTLAQFFSRVGARAESFELAMHPPLSVNAHWPDMYFQILDNGFQYWKPGQLSWLTLSDRNTYGYTKLDNRFFESSAHWFLCPQRMVGQHINGNGGTLFLDVSLQRFEEILSHINILELDVVYPFWASKAYHGLVELRLTGPRRLTTVITIRQLADILTSSPLLRVLYFGLEVSLTKIRPQPIYLEDLEVFLLHSLHHDTQQAVLKLIDPGSRPLQMSVTYNHSKLECLPARFDDEFSRFFRRSNIYQLHVQGLGLPVKLPDLLNLLPGLQTLILRDVRIEKLEPSHRDGLVTPLCPRLHNLHFRYCSFDLETLRWLIDTHKSREVTLHNSSIVPETECLEEDAHTSISIAIFPFVKILDHDDDIGLEHRSPSLFDIYSRMESAASTNYQLN